jgi:D-sedoheptulose 7-phosphate isomerase
VFLIANGGSSGVASHLVNDMVVGGMMPGRPPLRALALTDNAASVTAIGNDAGYEHVFSYQIEMLAGPGDVVIAMSVSGNSENIIRGVEAARRLGCVTIGWAGMEGGRLAEACDICVRVPSTRDEYGPVEDAFSVLGHAAVTWMIQRRGKKLHH